MTIDEQKSMSRRAIGMWASDNSVTAEELFADDYINHQESDVEGGVTARSLDEWKQLVEGFHNSFSNATTEISMQIAEGDRVATRWQFTATHSGDFMGVAPTGKTIIWTGVEIDRFEGGKIVESWVDWDKYRFFQGLGLAT